MSHVYNASEDWSRRVNSACVECCPRGNVGLTVMWVWRVTDPAVMSDVSDDMVHRAVTDQMTRNAGQMLAQCWPASYTLLHNSDSVAWDNRVQLILN